MTSNAATAPVSPPLSPPPTMGGRAEVESLALPPVLLPGNRPTLPRRRRWSRRTRVIILACLVCLIPGAVWGTVALVQAFRGPRTDLITHIVKRERLQVTVTEKGAIESANNHDIIVEVKGGNRAGSIAINWVIEGGTFVKEGQKVCELDSSGFDEQLKTQKIVMDKARNDYDQAEEHLKIVKSQNVGKLATAEIAVDLARRDRELYEKGEHSQTLKDIDSRSELADADLRQWRDRFRHTERMLKKDFISQTQYTADKARLRSAEIALAKVEEESRVLKLTYARKMVELEGKIREAERAQEIARTETAALEAQASKDRDTKKEVYEQEKAKHAEILSEIKKCILKAPADGLVVYYIPPQTRWGSGGRQTTIAQGETVTEGQKLLQIPDLNRLLVNVRIHESMESKVKEGQNATIRVLSYSNRVLQGRVKSVATVAAQNDWASDVRVYETMVEIIGPFSDMKLKPGMTAEVTIAPEKDKQGNPLVVDNALTVPVQAVVRVKGASPPKFQCFVKKGEEIFERPVKVGLSNEKMVEIKEGLEEGDEVVMNPQVLEGAGDIGAPVGGSGAPREGRPGGPGGPGGGTGRPNK